MCNTCCVQGHLYGTQALNFARWKFHSRGRLVCKHTKQPLSQDDFACFLMTDLSIQRMVDNSVSVSTTTADATHSRRVATSRLHTNTHAERLDIDETVREMEGLGNDSAELKAENGKVFKTLYYNIYLGTAAANRQPPGRIGRREQHGRLDATSLRLWEGGRGHAPFVG